MPHKTYSILPSLLALVLFALGVLLVVEVIRPFRDLAIDGPIALGCWGAGLALGAIAVWRRLGPRALAWTALICNAGALLLIWAAFHFIRLDRLF